jgi:hypothetical protein
MLLRGMNQKARFEKSFFKLNFFKKFVEIFQAGCVKKFFLFLHLVVSLGFTVALIVLIVIAKKSDKAKESDSD